MGREMILIMMEVAKGMPYRLTWQATIETAREIALVRNHMPLKSHMVCALVDPCHHFVVVRQRDSETYK